MSSVDPVPLAFVPSLPASVSLAGVVSEAARLNVLGDVKPILLAAGLPVTRPGAISTMIVGHESGLATRLGRTLAEIEALATPRLGCVGPERWLVRWGDGSANRMDLEMRRRRIAPRSLTTSRHHRATWMNRLLDYCPESLELLVDTCPTCARPLGWLAGWGIGHCDDRRCRGVPPSKARLHGDLVEGYRRFASLVSPVRGERSRAIDALHPDLQALQPTALSDLMLRLGAGVCGVGPVPRDGLRLMPAETKARAASIGTRMLEDWPLRLRSCIEDAIATVQDVDGSGRRRLRASLLTATGTARGPRTTHALLEAAVPESFQDAGRAFAGLGGERLLASTAARRLGIQHAELRQLAEAGVFQREPTFAGKYRRELYRADEIDAAAEAWRGSVPIAVVERAFGLPRYAAERLVACGDLVQETGAFVLSLPDQPRVRRESVDRYMETVCGAARRLQRSTDISVLAAMRAVGGRLKPWRQILDAIVRGRLPAALGPGDAPLSRRLLVAVEDIRPFLDVEADEGVRADFAFSATMSQMDAMSVLNLHQKDAPGIRSAGFLRFERVGRADIVPVGAVLAVAGAHMPLAEAVAWSGASIRECRRRLRATLGDQPSVIGWPRTAAKLLFPNRSGSDRLALLL